MKSLRDRLFEVYYDPNLTKVEKDERIDKIIQEYNDDYDHEYLELIKTDVFSILSDKFIGSPNTSNTLYKVKCELDDLLDTFRHKYPQFNNFEYSIECRFDKEEIWITLIDYTSYFPFGRRTKFVLSIVNSELRIELMKFTSSNHRMMEIVTCEE